MNVKITKNEDGTETVTHEDGTPLSTSERTSYELGRALDMIQDESSRELTSAIESFTKKIEGQRSRTAPIPPKEGEGQGRKASGEGDDEGEGRGRGNPNEYFAREFRVIGLASEPLYRKLEIGRSAIEVPELRAARNPRMDLLTAAWAAATYQKDMGRRREITSEMNDIYYRELGYGRAPLLEGTPDADSGFAAGTGGELLPLPLSGQLIMERDKVSKMRKLVNTFPMTTQTQRIPVLPTMTATSRVENAAYADLTPNPDSALLSAKDIGVSFSAGRNFLEDSAFAIANQLTVVAGGAIGAEEDIQICTSTANGADITEGIADAVIVDIAETTANLIGWEDFVNLYYGLPEQYRANAKFFATSTTLADVSLIKDGNARPIFVGALGAPLPISDLDSQAVGTLMGKPVYDVPMPDDVIFFGDPMWYALGDRTSIRIDVDRAVSTGLTTWVIDERIDGRVIPTSAVGTNLAWRKVIY